MVTKDFSTSFRSSSCQPFYSSTVTGFQKQVVTGSKLQWVQKICKSNRLTHIGIQIHSGTIQHANISEATCVKIDGDYNSLVP